MSWDSATGTVEWAEEVDTAITDYFVAYAMVVDNQTIETPVYSGDTLDSITNDDGDGMVESVERTGGLYEWTASIDSKKYPRRPNRAALGELRRGRKLRRGLGHHEHRQ